jgi:peptidoglycan/xylan/chitin deacetylase (PgdA/CDA1 family)
VTTDRLSYPHRRRGLDHDWFAHQPTHQRPPISWPDGQPVALWITVPIEFFPLDAPAQPVRPLGGLDRGYPDFWTYSARDYGLRIGIYRVMKVLDALGLRTTTIVNAAVAHRYPRVIDEISSRRWEIAAGGIDMGHVHHSQLSLEHERALVRDTREALTGASGHEIAGWHSPGHSQSANTLRVLAEEGFAYVMDWANDDLPYEMKTEAGRLYAMPLTYEWSDRLLLLQYSLTAEDYEEQVLRAFRRLHADAATYNSGRILSLSISPWIFGYPHRIAVLERLLKRIVDSGPVWNATGEEIVGTFRRRDKAVRASVGGQTSGTAPAN